MEKRIILLGKREFKKHLEALSKMPEMDRLGKKRNFEENLCTKEIMRNINNYIFQIVDNILF